MLGGQAAKGPLARAQANIEALELLVQLENSGRQPTASELETLLAYSGWGGAADAFRTPPLSPAWAEVQERLQRALSPEDYATARSSVLTAFYTPPEIIEAIGQSLQAAGFGQDSANPAHVLEPGCGTGNFITVMENQGLAFQFHGVEIDSVSARLAAMCHPGASITNADFSKVNVTANSFDLALGNVPYSDAIKLETPSGQSLPIHDFFIRRAVDSLRPGGVAALLTSRYTMDKQDPSTRLYVAQRAQLVAAYRLPAETFKAFAGTDVISDLLVFRKRENMEEAPQDSWIREAVELSAENVEGTARVNTYFNFDPRNVIGEQTVTVGRFGPTINVTNTAPLSEISRQVASDLTAALTLKATADRLGEAALTPMVTVVPETVAENFEYTVTDDGHVLYSNGEYVETVNITGSDEARLAAMVRLRNQVRDTLAFERSTSDEQAVAAKISALNEAYERFTAKFGQVNDRKNQKLWNETQDRSGNFLRTLEATNADGQVTGKGDILLTRVQAPIPPLPDHVDDPVVALTLSLDRQGKVDMDFIEQLTGRPREDLLEDLSDHVVADPETGDLVTASEYFSGDLKPKLDHVNQALRRLTENPVADQYQAWLDHVGLGDKLRDLEAKAKEAGTGGALIEALARRNVLQVVTDPDHANVVLDEYSGVNDAFYFLRSGTSQVASIEVVRRFQPGVQLTWQDHHGDYHPRHVLREIAATLRSNYLTNASWMLMREMARQPLSVVDADAFALFMSYYLDTETCQEIFGGMGMPTVSRADTRKEEHEQNRRAADWLRENTDAIDYVLLNWQEGKAYGPVERGVNVYKRDVINTSLFTPEKLAEYRANKTRFMDEHPVELDHEKIRELTSLRDRLTQALPARLAPEEIAVNLGAPWIPARIYFEFAKETFDLNHAYGGQHGKQFTLSRSDQTGTWQFNRAGAGKLQDSVIAEYGTPETNPLELFESALNGSQINLTKPDPANPGKRVKDPVATAAAYHARSKINEAFKEWVWKDETRAQFLTGLYNQKMNTIAPRTYDGQHLSLPGMNTRITLRPHQKDAIARILHSKEGTLLAHVVGAGKTFASIGAVMESRRIEKATKPLIVVPNHLTEQWAKDFLHLYPAARVLYMTKADARNKDTLRDFWAKAAAGNWDAVIVGHSRFDALRLSPERQVKAFQRRISELEISINEAREEGNRFSVKQLEAMRTRLSKQINNLREKGMKLDGISFEELGFDMLVVDEAHYYKNLAVMGRAIAGIAGSSSAKCENLLDLCDYLREAGHGANIVFATGTPVSNTMSELYNMQRYLAPKLLSDQGVYYFSDWVQTFGETVQSVEVKPEGTGFQIKERFAKFHNLPELMAAYHSYADIKTMDDLDLDVPGVNHTTIAIPADRQQQEYLKFLAARAQMVRSVQVAAAEDNMLKITHEGRALALSTKLLDPDTKPGGYGYEAGKLQAVAQNIHQIWRETAADRGAQMVFCDASTPGKGRWNVYDEIKQQLVNMGVPENQIAFIHDYDQNPKKRDQLFEKVNAGSVRVLFGSTQKLGVGTNAQARLAALHDVDCPWRPADLEQRLGRAQRQGNMYNQVQVFRYVTSGTFDSYLYQTVERKQRFISQVFTNKSPARTSDDLDETVLDYATIKAIASGDPQVREHLLKENRLQELELQKQSFGRKIFNAKQLISSQLQPAIKTLKEQLQRLVDDKPMFLAAKQATATAGAGVHLTLNGQTISDPKVAVEGLIKEALRLKAPGIQTIGEYCGLKLGIKRDQTGQYAVLTGNHNHVASKTFSLQHSGNNTILHQLNRLIDKVAGEDAKLREELAQNEAQLEDNQRIIETPWEFQEEYDQIKQEIAAFNQQINKPAASAQVEDNEAEDTETEEGEWYIQVDDTLIMESFNTIPDETSGATLHC